MKYGENKVFVGYSDKAELTLAFSDCESTLKMGEDGRYGAYITDEWGSIPDYYKLAAFGKDWLLISGDDCEGELFEADLIAVYRAGLRGIVILLANKEEKEV